MKLYNSFTIYLLFFKLINTFNSFIRYKIAYIFSKFFQNNNNNNKNSYKNKFLYNPNTIIESIETNCSLILNDCKSKIIIPGYMEHDPRIKVLQKLIKK
jgi:hypothetical protein